MSLKKIPAALITLQVVFGNFCFMDMAMAVSMPMSPEPEMETMQELVMTPVDASSPLHCDSGCITVVRPLHHADMAGMTVPCGDGHCLSEHTPSTAAFTQSPLKDSTAIALIAFSALRIEPLGNDILLQGSTGPPFVERSLTKTTVLRL